MFDSSFSSLDLLQSGSNHTIGSIFDFEEEAEHESYGDNETKTNTANGASTRTDDASVAGRFLSTVDDNYSNNSLMMTDPLPFASSTDKYHPHHGHHHRHHHHHQDSTTTTTSVMPMDFSCPSLLWNNNNSSIDSIVSTIDASAANDRSSTEDILEAIASIIGPDTNTSVLQQPPSVGLQRQVLQRQQQQVQPQSYFATSLPPSLNVPDFMAIMGQEHQQRRQLQNKGPAARNIFEEYDGQEDTLMNIDSSRSTATNTTATSEVFSRTFVDIAVSSSCQKPLGVDKNTSTSLLEKGLVFSDTTNSSGTAPATKNSDYVEDSPLEKIKRLEDAFESGGDIHMGMLMSTPGSKGTTNVVDPVSTTEKRQDASSSASSSTTGGRTTSNNVGTIVVVTPTISAYQSSRWQQRFNELCEYRKRHGHCLVPSQWSENPKLSQWVKRQRYQYKLKHEKGQHSTMTMERIKLLEDMGFVWDSHSAFWEERLNELIQFSKEHGHCIVPTRYPKNPELAVWAKCQRRHYKLYITKGPKKSSMTKERISKLVDVGFIFHPREYKKQQRRVSKTSSSSSSLSGRGHTSTNDNNKNKQSLSSIAIAKTVAAAKRTAAGTTVPLS